MFLIYFSFLLVTKWCFLNQKFWKSIWLFNLFRWSKFSNKFFILWKNFIIYPKTTSFQQGFLPYDTICDIRILWFLNPLKGDSYCFHMCLIKCFTFWNIMKYIKTSSNIFLDRFYISKYFSSWKLGECYQKAGAQLQLEMEFCFTSFNICFIKLIK